MLRRDLLRSSLATTVAGWLRSLVPVAAFGDEAGGPPNAAAIYRRAFGWAEGLRPEDRERISRAATAGINGRDIDGLIRKAAPALRAIREAAAIGRCDWGNETQSPENLGKDRLDISKNLDIVRVAQLSARRHVQRRRGRQALDDLFAGLTLAHRLGTGGVFIARLLECGCEVATFQAIGRILTRLDRGSLDDLSRRLDVLPPPEPASATIGPESRFITRNLRANLLAKGPVIAGEEWAEVGFGEEEAEMLRRLTGGDRGRLLAHLEATGPAFAELARRLDLARPGCRAALDEFALTEREVHPIAAMIVEHAWGVRHMVDRMRALRSMLRAGLTLVRDGEAACRAVPDPFGSGPFGLERTGNGYCLRSALNDDAKPEVTLAVGEVD